MGRGAGPQAAGTRDTAMSTARPFTDVRSVLDSARRQQKPGPWGTQPPHHQTGNADNRARRPDPPTTPTRPSNGRDHPRPLDKHTAISAVGPEQGLSVKRVK